MPHFREGQRVNYKPVGGPNSNTNKSIGVIHNVCTSKSSLTGRIVEASEAEPCYEVENVNTHKRSAVKEKNIIGPAE
ncbi:hypothetical protein N7533_007342 [Penicillium manginii]|uniref:uncharacterized protein n=1 Tax=Penicillium manginii TaxID=203109 RepID=UPI0025481E89|nr:uncharacterized protein N7533_007342 [Penicillium manginii]KAJ5750314.1 hypothetical protein N7533_007342 [Penicillium manginii]